MAETEGLGTAAPPGEGSGPEGRTPGAAPEPTVKIWEPEVFEAEPEAAAGSDAVPEPGATAEAEPEQAAEEPSEPEDWEEPSLEDLEPVLDSEGEPEPETESEAGDELSLEHLLLDEDVEPEPDGDSSEAEEAADWEAEPETAEAEPEDAEAEEPQEETVPPSLAESPGPEHKKSDSKKSEGKKSEGRDGKDSKDGKDGKKSESRKSDGKKPDKKDGKDGKDGKKSEGKEGRKSDGKDGKDGKKSEGKKSEGKEGRKSDGKKADGKKSPEPANCYMNREMSWLEFNRRVLMEAANPATPLLEKLKFLGIYQSNLEEFFMVRVGILTHREQMLPDQPDPFSGWTPAEQISHILAAVREQRTVAEHIWRTLQQEFNAAGIDVVDFRRVSKVDELMCKKIFGDVRPLLFPRVISDSAPFPFLWGKESYVIAWLGRGQGSDIAIIPLTNIPGYTAFEIDGRQKIVLTDQLVQHFLPLLFKKANIKDSAVIRLTRNADVFISEKLTDENFRVEMSAMLKKRKRQQPVRLQINGKLSAGAKSYLIKVLRIPEARVFSANMPFDLGFRSSVKSQPGFKYEDRKSGRDIGLKKGEYFSYIEKKDLLLSYPFQSMLPFVDLLYEAADDPEVTGISITLYRLAANSKVAAALAYAADRGKEVLCLLELRARFDEQNNIDYSELLEDAGCRVIYGLPDKKVHCKLCLITRRRGDGLSYITQVGTGNYNEVTGEQYCDLSLITADPAAAEDAKAVFASLAAGQTPPPAKRLWVAPLSFKQPLAQLLDREIAKGPRGLVRIKVNSVNHRELMKKLIECSQAGVRVELYVRGICCLRPGVPGLTENLSVKSIVGRWLEHSRIYCFGEGEDERMFIGSGDLLNRNVERRVEVFMEVRTPDTREQVRQILQAEAADRSKGWLMLPDGTYILDPGEGDSSSQEALYRYFYNRSVKPKAAAAASAAATPAAPPAAGPAAASAARPGAPSAHERKRGLLAKLFGI